MIYTSQLTHYNPGELIISQSKFYQCSSDYGGGMRISNPNLIAVLTFCIFVLCTSTSYGGGLAIDYSTLSKINSTVFTGCVGKFVNGYFCDGGVKDLLTIEMNQTSDYCPSETACCSCLGGTLHAICISNNHSFSNTNSHSSGAFYGSGTSEIVCRYCLLFKNNGPSFFGVRCKYDGIVSVFELMSFINNSASIGWIELHYTILKPVFEKCCYIYNTGVPIFRITYTSGGNPSFLHCVFSMEYNPSAHSVISRENNLFLITNCHVNPQTHDNNFNFLTGFHFVFILGI